MTFRDRAEELVDTALARVDAEAGEAYRFRQADDGTGGDSSQALVDPTSSRRGVSSPAADSRPLFAVGVTTWNRENYIRRFVETFDATRSTRFRWLLIIADDGSTDGTLDYLEGLCLEDCQVVIVKNKGATITGQTNAIFVTASTLGFDFGVKCDDDIYFTRPGWDELYYDAALDAGMDHLVYHNDLWKPPKHHKVRGALCSHVSAIDALGCFWTFTPRLLDAVGYFDEKNFVFRGHAHLDFTLRSCRAGYNDSSTLWDVAGSEDYISMWQRDEYIDTVDWQSPEVKRILSPAERQRRMELISQPHRQRIELPSVPVHDHRPAVELRPRLGDAVRRLGRVARFRVEDRSASVVDAAYVLNLDEDEAKWRLVAAALARQGIMARRFSATDGNADEHVSAWREYQARGLELPREREIGRRLIASPGAWGYLLTMQRLLTDAKKRRYRRIMVFDDDVVLHQDFDVLMRVASRELPQNWRLVYLGCTQKDWDGVSSYSAHLYRPDTAVDGSYAYMIDASTFDELLTFAERMDAPFDSGPLAEVAGRTPDRTFVVTPNVAIADVRYSDLRAPRDQDAFAKRARWSMSDYEPLPTRTARGGHPMREPDPGGLLSLVIVFDRSSARIAETIYSLRRQTSGEFEGVLFANGAAGEVMEEIRRAVGSDSRFRLLSVDAAVDWATAARLAADATVGPYVCFLPPGSVLMPSYVAEISGITSRSNPDAVRVTAASLPSQPMGGELGLEFVRDLLRRADVRVRPQLFGGAFSRSLIQEIGRFFGGTESAFEEALKRVGIGRALRRENAPSVLDGDATFDIVVDSRQLYADSAQWAEWELLHEEIRRRVRPAHSRVSGSSQPVRMWTHMAWPVGADEE